MMMFCVHIIFKRGLVLRAFVVVHGTLVRCAKQLGRHVALGHGAVHAVLAQLEAHFGCQESHSLVCFLCVCVCVCVCVCARARVCMHMPLASPELPLSLHHGAT